MSKYIKFSGLLLCKDSCPLLATAPPHTPVSCSGSHLSLLWGQRENPTPIRHRMFSMAGVAQILSQILKTPSRERSSASSKSHHPGHTGWSLCTGWSSQSSDLVCSAASHWLPLSPAQWTPRPPPLVSLHDLPVSPQRSVPLKSLL